MEYPYMNFIFMSFLIILIICTALNTIYWLRKDLDYEDKIFIYALHCSFLLALSVVIVPILNDVSKFLFKDVYELPAFIVLEILYFISLILSIRFYARYLHDTHILKLKLKVYMTVCTIGVMSGLLYLLYKGAFSC